MSVPLTGGDKKCKTDFKTMLDYFNEDDAVGFLDTCQLLRGSNQDEWFQKLCEDVKPNILVELTSRLKNDELWKKYFKVKQHECWTPDNLDRKLYETSKILAELGLVYFYIPARQATNIWSYNLFYNGLAEIGFRNMPLEPIFFYKTWFEFSIDVPPYAVFQNDSIRLAMEERSRLRTLVTLSLCTDDSFGNKYPRNKQTWFFHFLCTHPLYHPQLLVVINSFIEQ